MYHPAHDARGPPMSGGSLLGRLRAVTAAATTQPLLLLLCIAGLAALVVAAFRWQEIAGWAALGAALLLLEARLDRDLSRDLSRDPSDGPR